MDPRIDSGPPASRDGSGTEGSASQEPTERFRSEVHFPLRVTLASLALAAEREQLKERESSARLQEIFQPGQLAHQPPVPPVLSLDLRLHRPLAALCCRFPAPAA